MRLGVDAAHAYAFSRTRKGGWAVAQSPIMVTTVTLKRLQQRGYESMLDYYYKVAPQFLRLVRAETNLFDFAERSKNQ